jgi:hypothetical protein
MCNSRSCVLETNQQHLTHSLCNIISVWHSFIYEFKNLSYFFLLNEKF